MTTSPQLPALARPQRDPSDPAGGGVDAATVAVSATTWSDPQRGPVAVDGSSLPGSQVALDPPAREVGAEARRRRPREEWIVRSTDPDALMEYVVGCGGIALRRGVRSRFSEGALRVVLADGRLRSTGRSRLVAASAADAVAAAHRLGAVLSHRSAAAWWGWDLLDAPTLPEVAVRRGARVPPLKRRCDVHWTGFGEGEIRDGATAPLRTVLDCAGTLPFPAALAVADQALASKLVGENELRIAASGARGPGSAAKRRVAEAARAAPESVFESAVRGVLLDVPGLRLEPQVRITGDAFPGGVPFRAKVDLADRALRIVVEADSFEYHGGREGLRADAARYDELVARGWTVIRVTYDDLVARPEWIVAVVTATVALRRGGFDASAAA